MALPITIFKNILDFKCMHIENPVFIALLSSGAWGTLFSDHEFTSKNTLSPYLRPETLQIKPQ